MIKTFSVIATTATDKLKQSEASRPHSVTSTGKSETTRSIGQSATSAQVNVVAARRLLDQAESKKSNGQYDQALEDLAKSGLLLAGSLSTLGDAMSEGADAVRRGKGGVALTLKNAQVRATLNDAISILSQAVNLTQKVTLKDSTLVNATLRPGVEHESVKAYAASAKKEIDEAVAKSKEAIKLLKEDKVGVADKISSSVIHLMADAAKDTFRGINAILEKKQSLTAGDKDKLVEIQSQQQRMIQVLGVIATISAEASANLDKKVMAPGAKPEPPAKETDKLIAAASKLASAQQVAPIPVNSTKTLDETVAHDTIKKYQQSLKDAANALLEASKVSQRSVVSAAVASQTKESAAVATIASKVAINAIIQAASILNAIKKLQASDPRRQKSIPGKAQEQNRELHQEILAAGRQAQLLLNKVNKHASEDRIVDAQSGATEAMKLAAKGLETIADIINEVNLDRKDGLTRDGDERKLAEAITEAQVLVRAAAVAADAQSRFTVQPTLPPVPVPTVAKTQTKELKQATSLSPKPLPEKKKASRKKKVSTPVLLQTA